MLAERTSPHPTNRSASLGPASNPRASYIEKCTSLKHQAVMCSMKGSYRYDIIVMGIEISVI